MEKNEVMSMLALLRDADVITMAEFKQLTEKTIKKEE